MKPICLFLLLLIFTGCSKMSALNFNDQNARRSPAQSELASVDLLMSNRAYVDSVFVQVFGNPGNEIYQAKDFGGSCDPYSIVTYNTGKQDAQGKDIRANEFPRSNCNDGISVDQKAQSNSMRYATTMKTCEKRLNDTVSFKNVMGLIHGSSWKPNSNSFVITDEKIKKAYDLFYQNEEPDAEVINALKEVANTKTKVDDQWKMILLTICVSPGWQAI